MKRTKEPTAKLQDIMDKDDSQEKGGRRQLKRRTTDETIRKKVRDNFVGFTETELTMNLRQGLNVFDRIKADMKKSETTPQFRMGKLYYEELRNLYRDPESPLAALVPKDMTESVDKDLERSLCALLQTRRSTAELHQWAQHTTNINQLNLVALLRQVLKMPAIKSLESANIGISILKLFAKLKIHESFPSEWAAVKAHFDMCLVRTLAAFKSEEQTSSVWWEVHKDFAKLLLPERSMEAALSCETDWASVQAEVQEVYESSEVGRRLMARAIKQLETESVGARVAKAVQDLREVENITMAELEKNKKHFLAAMDMCHVDVNQPFMPRKEVPIEYRGVRASIIVMSPLGYYSVAIEAYVRSVACHLDLLPGLWCEAELVGFMGQFKTKNVDAELLKAAKVSRQACLDALADEFATSPNIAKVLQTKKNFVCSVDRFFRVELGFWFGSTGETAAARVRALILQCLPTREEKKRTTLAESVSNFSSASEGRLLSFAGASQQALFRTVHAWVTSMANGRTPDVDKGGSSGFVVEVKQRLALFCRHNDLQGADAAHARALEIKLAVQKKRPSATSRFCCRSCRSCGCSTRMRR